MTITYASTRYNNRICVESVKGCSLGMQSSVVEASVNVFSTGLPGPQGEQGPPVTSIFNLEVDGGVIF